MKPESESATLPEERRGRSAAVVMAEAVAAEARLAEAEEVAATPAEVAAEANLLLAVEASLLHHRRRRRLRLPTPRQPGQRRAPSNVE